MASEVGNSLNNDAGNIEIYFAYAGNIGIYFAAIVLIGERLIFKCSSFAA